MDFTVIARPLLLLLVSLNSGLAQSETPLIRAAENGELRTVKRVLAQKARVNAKDAAGCTALMLAVAGRDAPSDAEGDVIRRTDRRKERLEIVRLLLKWGARADTGGSAGCARGAQPTGVTPVMRAIEVGRVDMAQAMLKQPVKPRLKLEVRDSSGKSALQYAAQETSGLAVRQLIRAGVRVNARDPSGMTALMSAASTDSYAPGMELLKAGADPNARSLTGDTALHLTSSPAFVRLLLKHGAQLTLNDAGYSAYTLALWRRQRGLLTDLERLNPRMGFIDAVLKSDLAGVKRWLSSGASANARFVDETPLLHFAVRHSSAEVVKALIDAGAKVDAKDRYLERTPILTALIGDFDEPKSAEEDRRRIEVVTVLLDCGASALARDPRSNFSPVMYAAKRNSLPLVKLFLSRGALVSEEDLSNLTLLHPDLDKEVVAVLKAGKGN